MAILYINYTTDYGNTPNQVSVNIEDEGTVTFTEEHLPTLIMDGYQFDGWMLDDNFVRVGDISNIISIDTTLNLVAHWTVEKHYYGNATGGFGMPKMIELVDGDGNTFIGAVTDSEVTFTATDNDVRLGMTYAAENGASTGAKRIPSYETTQSNCYIWEGESYSIPLETYDKYDYTKLQALIAKYNSDPSQRMSVDKVVINDKVYMAGTSEVLSIVTKNDETKSIDLNIINDTEDVYIIYYFTYKEV